MEIWNLFGDYTFRLVAIGTAVLGIVCGVLGCFAVSTRQSLIGDAVSHSVLPGVVIAYMLTETKNMAVLLFGATIAGVLSIVVVSFIKRNTKTDFESILATVLSSFFGLGILLMTIASRMPGANKAGLDSFIYGQVASLLYEDVVLMIVVSAALLLTVFLFWKEFKLSAFDREFARVIGFPSHFLMLFLSMLIVTAIIIGLQTVGAILISSLLVAPAVASRQWTRNLSSMCILAGLVGALSGFSGTVISSVVPKMPTGPSIVVVASGVALLSLLISPRGVIQRSYRRILLKRSLIQRSATPGVDEADRSSGGKAPNSPADTKASRGNAESSR